MSELSWLWAWFSSWLPGNDEIIKDILKALILAVLGIIATWTSVRIRRWWRNRSKFGECEAKIRRARVALASDKGVFLSIAPSKPANYKLMIERSKPIITFANLKGGVGKTTITANVAGMLALRGEKILLIDLDFQGSLSSMMLGSEAQSARPSGNELSKASMLLSGLQDHRWLLGAARPSPVHPGLFSIPAFYDLARTENRLLVEWLIGDGPADMPYVLANLLLHDDVQAEYDRILIDAPPRMSAACIQALCASTHLVIPTVMDQLSAEAVSTFINEVEELKKGGLISHIRYGGVVGSMLPGGTTEYFRPAVNNLRDRLRASRVNIDLLNESTWIKDIPAIGRAAGQTIGVLQGEAKDKKDARDAFEPLVDELCARIPAVKR